MSSSSTTPQETQAGRSTSASLQVRSAPLLWTTNLIRLCKVWPFLIWMCTVLFWHNQDFILRAVALNHETHKIHNGRIRVHDTLLSERKDMKTLINLFMCLFENTSCSVCVLYPLFVCLEKDGFPSTDHSVSFEMLTPEPQILFCLQRVTCWFHILSLNTQPVKKSTEQPSPNIKNIDDDDDDEETPPPVVAPRPEHTKGVRKAKKQWNWVRLD